MPPSPRRWSSASASATTSRWLWKGHATRTCSHRCAPCRASTAGWWCSRTGRQRWAGSSRRRGRERGDHEGVGSVSEAFRGGGYPRHNARRLEHLASLGIDLFDKSVLEVGAGIGDLTSFFLDRGCTVTSVEARADNVRQFAENFNNAGYVTPVRVRLINSDVESMP